MVAIIDSTLREGEQTPGVLFTLREKKNIIDGLVKIGVDEVELGIVSPLIDCPKQLLRYCRDRYPGLRCSLWSRCLDEDISLSAEMDPDILALSLPVSDILLQSKLERDRTWARCRLQSAIVLARQLGLTVAVGFEDATRAERSFLVELSRLADSLGAHRIRLADTVGTATPGEMVDLVKAVRSVTKHCQITVHCHNDFGMATANAIAALDDGADGADTTVMGLGERCGCTPLEELAGFLTLRRDRSYCLEQLPLLASYVAAVSGRQVPENKPFIGSSIFTCETGLHLHALQRDPRSYEPYPPARVGKAHDLIIGPKAGRKAILNALRAKGYAVSGNLDEATARTLRSQIAGSGEIDESLIAGLLQRAH